jgi:hypothetical protein
MADNDSKEPLLSAQPESSGKHVETIVPFLLIVITSSGLCFSGLGNIFLMFNTTSLPYGILWVVLIALTYWLNSNKIVEALDHQKEESYSKLIKSLWGRKRGLTVQILMALNNVIILTYLQQRIAVNAFKVFNPPKNEYIEEQKATDVFYYVAIANIALILLALQNKYEKVKNFAIVSILVWIYLFIGVVAEAWNHNKGKGNITQGGQNRVTFLPEGYAYITTVGIVALFTSYFQIVPYVHHHIKNVAETKKVLKNSFIFSVVLIMSAGVYYVFYHNTDLNVIRYSGLTIIGSCIAILNVLPTRELIIQILDENAKSKSNTRDRIITVLLLSITLLLSIGLNSFRFLQIFIGIGILFTSLIGFIFPGWVALKLSSPSDKNKNIGLLVWNVLIGVTVFVSGVFIMIETDHTLTQ